MNDGAHADNECCTGKPLNVLIALYPIANKSCDYLLRSVGDMRLPLYACSFFGGGGYRRGLINYCGKFIPNMAQHNSIFTKLIYKTAQNKFSWSSDLQKRFDDLKHMFNKCLVVRLPNLRLPFLLT